MTSLAVASAPVSPTDRRRFWHRDPVNPSTTIEFTTPAGTTGSIVIYDFRGQRARMLLRGEFRRMRFRWDGTDDQGAAVASGVYLVRAGNGVTNRTAEVALVR